MARTLLLPPSMIRPYLAVLLALALAACAAPADDAASETGDGALTDSLAPGAKLHTTTTVNLRSAPAIANNVLDVLQKGTELTAVGGQPQNGFYAVEHDGAKAYVSAKYVTVVATSTPTSPTSGAYHVVYIGDSHSDYAGNARGTFGFLGQHLTELMQADGIPLSLFAASGSIPSWWLDDAAEQAATYGYTQTSSSPARRSCSHSGKTGTCVPKLGAILADHPSLFVIEQGTNLLGRSDARQQVRSLVAAIDGKADACLWVGAPNASTSVHSQASQDQLWQIIQQEAGSKCTVLDSRFFPYSPDANNDGEHLGMAAAGKWAEAVAAKIEALHAAH